MFRLYYIVQYSLMSLSTTNVGIYCVSLVYIPFNIFSFSLNEIKEYVTNQKKWKPNFVDEGQQNMLSQNKPLQHKDYFELKSIERSRCKESSLPPPSYLPKGRAEIVEMSPTHTKKDKS